MHIFRQKEPLSEMFPFLLSKKPCSRSLTFLGIVSAASAELSVGLELPQGSARNRIRHVRPGTILLCFPLCHHLSLLTWLLSLSSGGSFSSSSNAKHLASVCAVVQTVPSPRRGLFFLFLSRPVGWTSSSSKSSWRSPFLPYTTPSRQRELSCL